jgi:transketolase
LPDGWQRVLDDYRKRAVERGEGQAGIMISAEINDLLAQLPERMVGCADLEAPTSHKRSLHAFTAEDRGGAYVHCGVREHVMGAMANGMAAHGGVIPLAVTYLAFADYERPAMRMAALMGLPVKFVFSHDSIGVGKNGPTHQPVEILASLRAMPNMRVFRPADAVEAAECWALAYEHRSGPSTMVFARQTLPLVRTRHVNDKSVPSRCWRPARKWRWPSRHARASNGTAFRPPSSRCHAGNCSTNRTMPIVSPCSARTRCASVSKPPCGSAGTATSAIAAGSSA